MYTINYEDLLESSICLKCRHLVSRTIIPIDYEEFGLQEEDFNGEEDEDVKIDDVAMIHNTCIILNMDLGHIVMTCNKFEKENEFFKEKKPF